MSKNFLKIIALLIFSLSINARGNLLYSQPVDIYNFFNFLSKDFGDSYDQSFQKNWIRKHGNFSSEDKEHLKNYREIRTKYDKQDLLTNFSLAFFKARDIDQAILSLKSVVSQDELVKLAKCFKHFKERVSFFSAQSKSYQEKIEELEKRYAKNKVLQTYNDALKFFDLKKSNELKMYLVWSMEETFSYEVKQNVIILKMNPLDNVVENLSENKFLSLALSSLFKALSPNDYNNLMTTLNRSCLPNIEEILITVMGKIHKDMLVQKKTFELYSDHFVDKKSNLLAITISNLYESQYKSGLNINGSFANKVAFLCEQVK